MKNAIIIGISGQDGAYLAELLLEKGYKVYGITRDILDFDDKKLRYLGINNNVEIIELSSLDKDRIIKVLKKIAPDEIYNLSSQSSVGYSFLDPFSTLNYNILSVLNWLYAIKATNSKIKFYQASSSEMFGNVPVEDLPLKESLIFRPASPYGISKAAAHWLAVNYRESNNIFSSCGILFNHESPLRGEKYVVKKIINTALKIKKGLQSAPLALGNLEIKRDWGYAPEYVKAMWLILQQKNPGDFLICSGNVMALKDLVNEVFKILGLETSLHLTQDSSLLRPVDLEIIYGDNTKAKKQLGWNYDISNSELIRKLIKDEENFIDWEINIYDGKN
ncbi:MAG: gmd [Chitinophagaceae bacterium]|nr:gmd [Chitinophagaceae bacterium]